LRVMISIQVKMNKSTEKSTTDGPSLHSNNYIWKEAGMTRMLLD